ncbi:MAG: type II toxin-antitoxin system VapB family antitoxin [Gaiellaceae bacterium]
MGRTNVVVDDALVERVMRLYGLKTKREAIDYALRTLAGLPAANKKTLALRGSGWDGDLEALRTTRVSEP